MKPIDSIEDARVLKSQDSNEHAVVSAECPSADVMVPGQGLTSNEMQNIANRVSNMAGRAKLRASHQVVIDTKIKDAKLRNSI